MLVAVPPAMLTKTSQIEGVVGAPVTMSCEATGTPGPKYEFHKVCQDSTVFLQYLLCLPVWYGGVWGSHSVCHCR